MTLWFILQCIATNKYLEKYYSVFSCFLMYLEKKKQIEWNFYPKDVYTLYIH